MEFLILPHEGAAVAESSAILPCVLPSLEAIMTKNEVACLYNCNINIFQMTMTELYRCEIKGNIYCMYQTTIFDFKDQLQALFFS